MNSTLFIWLRVDYSCAANIQPLSFHILSSFGICLCVPKAEYALDLQKQLLLVRNGSENGVQIAFFYLKNQKSQKMINLIYAEDNIINLFHFLSKRYCVYSTVCAGAVSSKILIPLSLSFLTYCSSDIVILMYVG